MCVCVCLTHEVSEFNFYLFEKEKSGNSEGKKQVIK